MAASTVRHRSKRHRGVYFRLKADGSRTYNVYHEGAFVPAGTTEGEALGKQAELRGAKAKGEKPILPGKTTFAELAETWFESKKTRLRPRTASYYRSALDLVLLPRFGRRPVAALDADAIAKLVRDLESEGLHAIDPSRPTRPLGHSSIENYLKPLGGGAKGKGILDLAVRRHLIGVNPRKLLTDDERPKREEKPAPHEWTEAELSSLLQAAETNAAKTESRMNYAPLLRLASSLGLRIGELLGLQWQDFDREKGYLHVKRQWLRTGEYGPTKTKAGVRSIALPPDLREELLKLRLASHYSQDSDPIFASWNGTPLGHRNVTRRGWEAARDLAGLPKSLTFHDLRHAAASRMIARKLSPVVVAKTLGHENANVTLGIYAHLYDRENEDEEVRRALGGAS